MKKHLQDETKFDLILIDPPWENKHVKRTLKRRKLQSSATNESLSNTYEMLDNDRIGSQLPITQLLKNNGILVIYCTNSLKHQKALQQWLKNWKMEHVTLWFWLKVNYLAGVGGFNFF